MTAQLMIAARAAAPGAVYAGIVRTTGAGRIYVCAATDPVIDTLTLFQCRVRQGPYNIAREGHAAIVNDLGADSRWPQFAAAVTGVGVIGVLTVAVDPGDGTQGALTLYSTEPDAFSADDETITAVFADRAAAALAISSSCAAPSGPVAPRHLAGPQPPPVKERGAGPPRSRAALPLHGWSKTD